MTSRQRLMAVLNHQLPDRVPVSTYELVGWNFDSWENKDPSYKNLMDYIRDKTDCMYMTGVNTVNRYIREHTHVEHWNVGSSHYSRVTISTPKGDLTSLSRRDDNIHTTWTLEHLLKTDSDIERYLSIPDDVLPVDTGHLKKQEEMLGDRGILLISIADPLCIAADLFEFGEFTLRAFYDKKTFFRLMDKIFEQQMFYLQDMLKKGAGPLFRICGAEYATPPYLQPKDFHEYVCRYEKEMIQLIHDYGQYARIHCHGRIKEVLPHIMELEPDAMDPVEAPPSGDIHLGDVKKITGDKICLMGNIQLKWLETASEDQIRDIVIDCMKEAKAGGNFVIMPTAAPINIPLSPVTERNYRVFIDTALEYGIYK